MKAKTIGTLFPMTPKIAGPMIAHGQARQRDPGTSKQAADKAPTGRAAAVLELMQDGNPRTDEQIAESLDGYTDTSARHGRKALADRGMIEKIGETTTKHGRQTSVWRIRR